MLSEPSWSGSLDVRFTFKTKKGRRVFEVLRPLAFHSKLDGNPRTIRIRRGFHTDFASVPLVVRKFIHPVGKYAPAAVIHDYLYINRVGDRKTADRIFLEAMESLGVNPVTRTVMYRAVRMFGNSGWGR